MKTFFDTEFTKLQKNNTPISIGIKADNGDSFYAEFTDYDESQVDDWIRKNVIDNLSKDDDSLKAMASTTVKGTKEIIHNELMKWLDKYNDQPIQFISDVCHYDFVLLIDLIAATALDMPKNISPICYDINYDIASYFDIPEKDAFDMSREEILGQFNIKIPGEKHNSIYDENVIEAIYNSMYGSIN
jgi:hypothetical protein